MKLNEIDSISRYISNFYRMGNSFLIKEYKGYDIGAGQYPFLIQLYLKEGISHDELTEKMSVDKATTTRAIIKLEEAGYVKRVLNEKDRRKYHIYLTDKAVAKKDEILLKSYHWENQLIGSLDKEELESLFSILRKMAKNNPGYFFEKEEEK